MERQVFFEKGIIQGADIYYYPDGKLDKILSYCAGKKNGLAIYFEATGYILMTLCFKDGLKSGVCREYERGVLWHEIEYKDDVIRSDVRYENGAIIEKRVYSNGILIKASTKGNGD
jgi:antitoxin component YwqK of YwqJK toxin-antitoxin module